jgi:hypothetical protein
MRVRSSRKSKIKPVIYITLLFAGIIGLGLLLPRLFAVVGAAAMTPVHVLSQWYETSEDTLRCRQRSKRWRTNCWYQKPIV